jgi:hypothetical protein
METSHASLLIIVGLVTLIAVVGIIGPLSPLELDAASDANMYGEASKVVAGGACKNDCNLTGQRVCVGSTAVKTCGQYDRDKCLDWSPSTMCADGTICSNGACVPLPPSCTNECAANSFQCLNVSHLLQCGNFDADSCTEWGFSKVCAAGSQCSNGACVPLPPSCTDECSLSSDAQCLNQTAAAVCGNFDADSCLEWQPAFNCAAGSVCVNNPGSNASCVASCTDECSPAGSHCTGTGGYVVCGSIDEDTCLEALAYGDCAPGSQCVNTPNGPQCIASPTFSIDAQPPGRIIGNGTTSFTVSLTPYEGVQTLVNLSVTGCPGICVYDTPVGVPSFNTTLRVYTTNLTASGNYPITIVGFNGYVYRSIGVTVIVP